MRCDSWNLTVLSNTCDVFIYFFIIIVTIIICFRFDYPAYYAKLERSKALEIFCTVPTHSWKLSDCIFSWS